MKIQRGNGKLGFHPYFDIRHKYNGRFVRSTRRPHFTPKEIPWYSFLIEAEWTLGLLNANRRRRALENFQETYRETKPEPYVLWCSASTN